VGLYTKTALRKPLPWRLGQKLLRSLGSFNILNPNNILDNIVGYYGVKEPKWEATIIYKGYVRAI
jgi:hypothetical protein